MVEGSGTATDPWVLTTAPGSSTYTMYADPDSDPPALVCQVGSTTLRYHLSAIEDLHRWLVEQGGWVDLGATDEKKAPAPGTVEAWGRSSENPVGGWYGLRKGYRGRFGMYLPPLLEAQGLPNLLTRPATTRSAPAEPIYAGSRRAPPKSAFLRRVRLVVWRRKGILLFDYVVGVARWALRVNAYATLLVTDRYRLSRPRGSRTALHHEHAQSTG